MHIISGVRHDNLMDEKIWTNTQLLLVFRLVMKFMHYWYLVDCYIGRVFTKFLISFLAEKRVLHFLIDSESLSHFNKIITNIIARHKVPVKKN